MSLLAGYNNLSSKSSTSQVQAALNAIIKANSTQISGDERISLVKQILDDLEHKETGRLRSSKDLPLALEALKTLGRSPDAAVIVSTKPSLTILLKNTDISLDVVRTIANALLLQAEGRQNFIDVGGGDFALKMLSSNSDPNNLFLASRLLFLMTHDPSSVPFMRQIIEKGNLLEITNSKMDILVKHINSDPMAKEALSDMMKYIYSITLHFSRAEAGNSNLMMGEAWSDKLGSLVAPIISCFHTVPFSLNPSVPFHAPMTHIVHCLLSIPIENYKDAWYSTPWPSVPVTSGPSNFLKTARSLFTSRSVSPTPPSLKRSDPPSKSKNSGSRNPSPCSSSSSSSSSPPATRSSMDVPPTADTVQRCFNLINCCLEHYFPGNVESDAKEVRNRAASESVNLDELLSGPLLLVRKLVDGDVDARRRAKNWILPDDLDRTEPLESRSDTLGKLVRLLSSVYHPRLASCAGEVIFAICDSDPSVMSAQIGYGNAAGYLFNKGILSAPPPPSTSGKGKEPRRSSSSDSNDSDDGQNINPITGTVYKPGDRSVLDDMTEEEKEREAEKLFVLFDRLEKSGIARNPIKQALHEGKLEQYKE